jgi:hypothetical protein
MNAPSHGSRRTFVLIPGAGGTAWYWHRIVPLLREAGHAAIAVDLPPVPIRAVAGADDRFFPVGFQQALARDRLGIEADVLPGGHLNALAQPARLAGYLLGV